MKLKKKHIQSFEKLSGIGKLLQIGLWAQAEKFFGTRSSLNEEIVTYLDLDKEFKQKIRGIQREFNIPKLSLYNDLQIAPLEYEGDVVNLEVHQWLESQPKEKQELFDKAIYIIIEILQLPLNFYDWLKSYILYGKPTYVPAYNFELIDQVINHVDEIERFTLSTQEKKFILTYFKLRVSKNKNIPKVAFRKAYKELKEVLKRSKNRLRRYRTSETAIKTLEMGKAETYHDSTVGLRGSYVTHKTTSADLATTIFKDNTGKKAVLVRKQKQRLKERAANLLNKK